MFISGINTLAAFFTLILVADAFGRAGGHSTLSLDVTEVNISETRELLSVFLEEPVRRNDQGEGLVKHYSSILDYVMELSNSSTALPVPIFDLPSSKMSIPVGVVIGTQKGGTQNVVHSLCTHPLMSPGQGGEYHFFDQPSDMYPERGEWPGDGKDGDTQPEAMEDVLYHYAHLTKRKGYHGVNGEIPGIESSPLYMVHPLAPYRMRMVYPQAKIIVLLRDPTARYYSSLRMLICLPGHDFEEDFQEWFHEPGNAVDYVKQAELDYAPYTPLCKGVNATFSDLENCYTQLLRRNPLHRGIYADQLERWFRVFDRAQIMIVSSTDLFSDMTGTLAQIADHVGLPAYDFKSQSSFQHKSTDTCKEEHDRFFVPGGRFDQMLQEQEIFREFYRPHNRRLYNLLGRDLQWG